METQYDTILTGSATELYDKDNPVFADASELSESPLIHASKAADLADVVDHDVDASEQAEEPSPQLPSTNEKLTSQANTSLLHALEAERDCLKKENMMLKNLLYGDRKHEHDIIWLSQENKRLRKQNESLEDSNHRLNKQIEESKKMWKERCDWATEQIYIKNGQLRKLRHDHGEDTEDEEESQPDCRSQSLL